MVLRPAAMAAVLLGAAAPAEAGSPPPNVVVVLFDTLRADRTEPYGSQTVPTPRLRRLSEEGATFVEAHATSSYTRCSVASLFTGLYPRAHKTITHASVLPESLPSLPQILRQSGYRTLSLVKNPQIDAAFGFGRGFDEVRRYDDAPWDGRNEGTGAEDRAARAFREHVDPFLCPGQPFFLYVHELDPHAPYAPPRPYDRLSGAATTRPTRQNTWLEAVGAGEREGATLARPPRPAERDAIARYEGEIAFMDRYLDRLLDGIEARSPSRDTIVVFLSDHGEELLDHGRIGHDLKLYEESIRIPLVLRAPGRVPAGVRVDAPAHIVDVAPTILHLAGIAVPASMQGRSLLPYVESPGRTPPRTHYAALEGKDYRRDSIRHGRYKLIESEYRGKVGHELYDLEEDPREQHDLHAQRPEIASDLLSRMRGQHRGDAARGAAAVTVDDDAVDEELRRSLEALGYLDR